MNRKYLTSKDLAVCGLFAAVTAVLTQISLPLGAVPFSLGILGAMLTGVALGPKLAFFSQLSFLLLGAVGAPVFTQFQGGPQKLLGPTGGYLLGYLVMAPVISLLCGPVGFRFGRAFAAAVCGVLCCYVFGTAWLAFSTGIGVKAAILTGALPFLPLDIVKAALAAVVGPRLRKRLQ